MFLPLKDSPRASFQWEASIHTNACSSPPHSHNLRYGRDEHKMKKVSSMISPTQREDKEETGFPSENLDKERINFSVKRQLLTVVKLVIGVLEMTLRIITCYHESIFSWPQFF